MRDRWRDPQKTAAVLPCEPRAAICHYRGGAVTPPREETYFRGNVVLNLCNITQVRRRRRRLTYNCNIKTSCVYMLIFLLFIYLHSAAMTHGNKRPRCD